MAAYLRVFDHVGFFVAAQSQPPGRADARECIQIFDVPEGRGETEQGAIAQLRATLAKMLPDETWYRADPAAK